MIDMLPGISSTASALNAERVRMEIVSQNIANANTSRGINGQPYQRQQVVFETVLRQQEMGATGLGSAQQQVRVGRIENDPRPAKLVHDPGNPDADARGMVSLPNINIHEEMADLITSSRSFEANLAVIKNARTLATQTLAIGKRS